MKEKVKISAQVAAPLDKVWAYWNYPEHITKWNYASDEWHCPSAKSDFQDGGKFSSRMEAKDGSMGFDFGGTFVSIEPHQRIHTLLDDDRNVVVTFEERDGGTLVTEEFEAEDQNPVELQKQGWQAILNNFKSYTENYD